MGDIRILVCLSSFPKRFVFQQGLNIIQYHGIKTVHCHSHSTVLYVCKVMYNKTVWEPSHCSTFCSPISPGNATHTRPVLDSVRNWYSSLLTARCNSYFPLRNSLAVIHHSAVAKSVADPSKVEGLRPLLCWNCGFESRWGHGCLSVVKSKGTSQDNQDKETSTEKVQREKKRRKLGTKNPAGDMDVYLLSVLCVVR